MDKLYEELHIVFNDYKHSITEGDIDKNKPYFAINKMLKKANEMTPPAILSDIGYTTLLPLLQENYTQILGEIHSISVFLKLSGIDYDDVKKTIYSANHIYIDETSMSKTVRKYNTISDGDKMQEWIYIIYLIVMFD